MYCPNCGAQNRSNANYCKDCGAQLHPAVQPHPATQQPPTAPPPSQPIIVHTQGSGGIFSGCSSVINFVLAALVIGLIALIMLVFLCVIRLPASVPIFEASRPMADLWSRAVDWQGNSCTSSGGTTHTVKPQENNPVDNPEDNGAAGADECNRSQFVKETVPDHSVYAPGKAFTKTWTVRNAGTCTWTTDYSFRFTQGSRMGGEKSLALTHEVAPGETYTFKLDLTAPDDPDTYTGRWEIFNDQENSFGWYSVVIDVVKEGQKAQPKDATLMVSPSAGAKCSNFAMNLSGYAPNESIAMEISYFDNAGVYKINDLIKADSNGKATYRWYADVTKGGQYVVWGRADSAVGSAVFIVEAEGEGTCACIQADNASACAAAGGEWRHIYLDPGPSIDTCICPGEGF